jgi:hypothetical protein
LDADGITNQIQIHKGLGHIFANPSGKNYAQQTANLWDETLYFLRNMFKIEESSFLLFLQISELGYIKVKE